jgi:hypothetical protein
MEEPVVASLGEAQNVETGSSILERLRAAYEKHGFSFVVEPGPETLPDFLGSYRPDAIAQKKGENVIIEIMRRQRSPWEEPFADLHDRIAGHKDWKLNVVYAVKRPEDSIVLPVAHLDTLHHQIAEVEGLQAGGHHRAAFILAWSVLEAVIGRPVKNGTRDLVICRGSRGSQRGPWPIGWANTTTVAQMAPRIPPRRTASAMADKKSLWLRGSVVTLA